MAAEAGRVLAVQINTTGSTYADLMGLRTKSVRLNASMIDVTNSDSDRWREILDTEGIRSATFSGSGVFVDKVNSGVMIAAHLAQEIKNYKVVVPGLGTFTAALKATTLEIAGTHDGAITYNVTLESSGEIEFTAEA